MSHSRKLQLTLAILKPDLIANPAAKVDIIDTIIRHKFYIIKTDMLRLSKNQAKQFYGEHEGKFFYNRLVNFICSGPINVHILARDDACNFWRSILGPTKVFKTIYSAPNSVRGRYGLTDTRNAAHGSDSEASARKEIQFFFPDFEIKDWYINQEEYFQKGLVTFERTRQIHLPQV